MILFCLQYEQANPSYSITLTTYMDGETLVRKSNIVEVGVSVDRLVMLTAKFKVRVSVWLRVILSDNLSLFPLDIMDKTLKITL